MIGIPPLVATAAMCFAAGQPHARAGGVTVITHGFNSNVENWIIPMAVDMENHPGVPGAQTGCYKLQVSSTGSPATMTRLAGTAPTVSDSGEVFIKLDWSAVDGLFQASSTQVAQRAVNALLDTLLTPDTGGRPLVELPLHLVGHSRGASVVTEMARLLGEQGIWVDQVTTQDPQAPSIFFSDDPDVRIWENVLYADNFWQDISGEAITGISLTGAYNRKLLSLSGGNPSAHSDVHLWYHGTVTSTTPFDVDGAILGQTQRTSWWTDDEAEGALAGYHYSRMGGGDRLSTAMPAGAGTNRIRDGFNGIWDLGGDPASNRFALPSNNGLWPNVIRCQRPDSAPVMQGGAFNLDLHYQAGTAASGNVDLTVLLDADANPWNGNEIEIDAGTLAKTGPDGVNFIGVSVNTTTAPVGSYRVAARLDDGGRKRVLHTDGLLEIVATLPPPSIAGNTVRMESGLLRFTVLGSPGQTVEVQAAENLEDWEEIETHIMTSGIWEFIDPDTAGYPARFYRVGEPGNPP